MQGSVEISTQVKYLLSLMNQQTLFQFWVSKNGPVFPRTSDSVETCIIFGQYIVFGLRISRRRKPRPRNRKEIVKEILSVHYHRNQQNCLTCPEFKTSPREDSSEAMPCSHRVFSSFARLPRLSALHRALCPFRCSNSSSRA